MQGAFKQQIGRIVANNYVAQSTHRSELVSPGRNLNKSTLSAINPKSEAGFLSDVGDTMIGYATSRKRPALQQLLNESAFSAVMKPPPEIHHKSNTSMLTYKELMDIKGSKCTCIPESKSKCGTYCKKQGPNQ